MIKKILILTFLLSLTACSNQNLGADAPLEAKISAEQLSIKSIQDTEFSKIKKYKYIPKYTKDDLEYEVFEYKMPDGKVGYTQYARQTINGEIYEKAKSTGPLAEERTYDWKLWVASDDDTDISIEEPTKPIIDKPNEEIISTSVKSLPTIPKSR